MKRKMHDKFLRQTDFSQHISEKSHPRKIGTLFNMGELQFQEQHM